MRKILGGRVLTLAALTLTATLAGGYALASGWNPASGGGRHGGFNRRALASLDLSDDQKAKIKAVFEAEKPTFQALRTEGQAARQALRTVAGSTTPDPAQVGQAYLRLDANRKAARAERQKVHASVNALLTPDQQARLASSLSNARGRWKVAPPAGSPTTN